MEILGAAMEAVDLEAAVKAAAKAWAGVVAVVGLQAVTV